MQIIKVASILQLTHQFTTIHNPILNSYIAASKGDGEGTGKLARAHQLAKAQELAKAKA